MKSYTIKNIIKLLVAFIGKGKIVWLLSGDTTSKNYEFCIHDAQIDLTVSKTNSEGTSVKAYIPNIDSLYLQDTSFHSIKFSHEKFTKDNSERYKLIDISVQYEIQVLIEIMRLMREHAFIEFRHGDNIYTGKYIEGRITFRDITIKDRYVLIATDLFTLNKEIPNYEITKIGAISQRQSFWDYQEEHKKLASVLHLAYEQKRLVKERGECYV